MNVTHTAYIPADDLDEDDLVIARRLSPVEAMKIALGYQDRWSTHLIEDNFGSFVLYTWAMHPHTKDAGRAWTLPLQATFARGGQPELERLAALDMIAAQFLRRQTPYWTRRVVADTEYDSRLERVAQKRAVRRIDREIATKVVDALITDGYSITCDLQDLEPEFVRSTDRDGILEYMWQMEWVEMNVHKENLRGWLRLIFGENGFDLVQDYTVDLEHIVEPICEPYWRTANEADLGFRALALETPEDALKIEGMMKW
ncbi:hypothetical protein [Bradyrhizobium canariense]|uniref:hypothetical protein n=1 Tax=Bradyrhizobium canariense TaxID=255045 RepID=UPI001957CF31|nr:hypothetical protein [Bradyrhizobium canariense]